MGLGGEVLFSGREVSHPGQGPQSCSTSLETGKNIPLLLGPHPRPAGLIASAIGQGVSGFGCPVLTAAGRGSQPSVCPLTPAQSFPGFPAPHLLPAPCHCCLPPELSPLGTWDTVGHRGPGWLVTTFPSSLCATGWSASLQVPACLDQSQGCWGGGSPPPLTP